MEILEHKPKCCFNFGTHGRLCFGRKTRGKGSTRMTVFLVGQISHALSWLEGRPSVLAPSSEKKKKWEGKVPAIRYNHTILSLSTTIPSVLVYEPVGGDASLPGPPLVFGTSCLQKTVQTNCIMTNGGPNIVGARRLGTSDSVATNFASTPKQAEQHDNGQALSVSTRKWSLRFGEI